MLKPVGKRVIVQGIEVNYGNVLVTGIKPTQFKVMQIGDEITKVAAGDIVYLDKYQGTEIEHEKEKFLMVDEASILAKIQ